MRRYSLGGEWTLSSGNTVFGNGRVPGSVYSILMENGKIEDPHFRRNELEALKLMEQDYAFSRRFFWQPDQAKSQVLLHCEGLDTICDITINDQPVGSADNMHRIWEFPVTEALNEGENTITVNFHSPTKWIRQALEQDYIGGSWHAMKGFPHMRKAHCMFGWDWGPRLPDAGIWRDIYLLEVNSSRLTDIRIHQYHNDGSVSLQVDVEQQGEGKLELLLTSPDQVTIPIPAGQPFPVPAAQLWWPNNLGKQPLYNIEIKLIQNGQVVDKTTKRIGLRTMTTVREKDEWGESFAHCVNGIPFFAMGADYIPEDNILSRITPERTRKLLNQCAAANFNTIRVWGGGYYPDDDFYDICDELGLVVWQDFMFACANYRLTYDFEQNIRAELRDNISRIRHHACLGLWCGNNEMEMLQLQREYDGDCKTKADYIRMFEHVIPEVLRVYDPDTFYWPASPSSGGSFDNPNDPNRGDVHYWEVWHGGLPFHEYRNYYFRYASEFGFQSFPSLKTIEHFTLPEERNIFSRTMEMHQRNEGANGKIMNYLSQTYLYPRSLDLLIYASQLLQAEAMKYGIEHWRRNRGRCMGAIYWQLNDIWPVASWASIDFFGRWKALHYFAKRFFAPVMISCHETGETTDRIAVTLEPTPIETSAALNVTNETHTSVSGTVRWALRKNTGQIITQGSHQITVPAFSSIWLDKLIFDKIDFLTTYFSYTFETETEILSQGTVLFTAPKHFEFLDPQLQWQIDGKQIHILASAYAKNIEISSPDCELILSDNYFDSNGETVSVRILEGDPQALNLRSVYDIR